MKFENIKNKFEQLMCNCEGICGFISDSSSEYLKNRLANIENMPITKVQFDQLLSLQNIKCISDGFFRFYWLTKPKHFYMLQGLELDEDSVVITSLEQLYWGFNRLFTDCLYVFGNIQKGLNYYPICHMMNFYNFLKNIWSIQIRLNIEVIPFISMK